MFPWTTATLLALTLFAASACGLEHAYHTISPNMQRSGAVPVTLGVHDQRPAVLQGDADPDYVGLVRSGFGIPYHVSTESDQPFAHDFADALARGLERGGHTTKVVRLDPSTPSSEALAALVDTGVPRIVLVKILDWKCDTYIGTSLVYDVEMYVTDAEGKLLGRAQVKGADSLGGNAEAAVSNALQQKLEALLNDAAVVNAIQSGG